MCVACCERKSSLVAEKLARDLRNNNRDFVASTFGTGEDAQNSWENVINGLSRNAHMHKHKVSTSLKISIPPCCMSEVPGATRITCLNNEVLGSSVILHFWDETHTQTMQPSGLTHKVLYFWRGRPGASSKTQCCMLIRTIRLLQRPNIIHKLPTVRRQVDALACMLLLRDLSSCCSWEAVACCSILRKAGVEPGEGIWVWRLLTKFQDGASHFCLLNFKIRGKKWG